MESFHIEADLKDRGKTDVEKAQKETGSVCRTVKGAHGDNVDLVIKALNSSIIW